MLTALYLALTSLGVLLGFITKRIISPEHWYLLLLLAAGAFTIHGVILDSGIGYPPWGDADRIELLKDVGLGVRGISWFSFGFIWGCIGAIGLLLRKQ